MSLSCGVPVLPGNLVRNTLRSRASAGRPALVRVAHGGAGGIVDQALVEQVAPLVAVQRGAEVDCRVGETAGDVESHPCLALTSLLGGDEDDTVGGTRAVERGRRGILDDGDVFDVRGVQRAHDLVFE